MAHNVTKNKVGKGLIWMMAKRLTGTQSIRPV